jgi:hypothetical protein
VHGSNARNLCIAILISSWEKCLVFLIISYAFSSKKLEKAEQVLSGSEGGGGEREGVGGRRERWPKQ